MPRFRYRAKTPSGKYVEGFSEANGESEVMDEIESGGMIPVEIAPVKAKERPGPAGRLFGKRVKTADLVMLCRQMYSLSKAGIPIMRAIAGLGESADNPRLRESLKKLNRDLIGGRSLAASMAAQPEIYGPMFVSLINAGESSGRLEAAFDQLAVYLDRDLRTRQSAAAAMRYPAIVLIFIGAALIVLNIFVIPVFADMFGKMGVELPLATRILIGCSRFFVRWWPALLGGAVLAVFAANRILARPAARLRWDRLKTRLPVIGPLATMGLLGRFCRSFALMISAGVPLNLSIRLVAESLGNKFLEERVSGMRAQIERGVPLARAAAQTGAFSPLVLQMFAVGDETGRLDELLNDGAEYYERELDYAVKSLATKIEPLLLLIVAGMVTVLALGIFTPMWDMYGAMQGR